MRIHSCHGMKMDRPHWRESRSTNNSLARQKFIRMKRLGHVDQLCKAYGLTVEQLYEADTRSNPVRQIDQATLHRATLRVGEVRACDKDQYVYGPLNHDSSSCACTCPVWKRGRHCWPTPATIRHVIIKHRIDQRHDTLRKWRGVSVNGKRDEASPCTSCWGSSLSEGPKKYD